MKLHVYKHITRFGCNKKDLIQKLKMRDGLICGICRKSLEEEYRKYKNYNLLLKTKIKVKREKRININISVDHIIPYSLSKNNDIGNLQLAHITCNKRKGNSYPQATQTNACI